MAYDIHRRFSHMISEESKTMSILKKETKMKMAELLPLKKYLFT